MKRLPRVTAPGLTKFKKHLGNALRHMVLFLGCPEERQELDLDDSSGSLPTQKIYGSYSMNHCHRNKHEPFLAVYDCS